MSKSEVEHYWLCRTCATLKGGVFPEGHVCTARKGECPYCKSPDETLIPWVDFDWPKDDLKDRHAKVGRD